MPPFVMSSPPPVIDLAPSRTLRAALVVMAVLAAVSVVLSALPLAAVLLVPVLLWSAWPATPAWRAVAFANDGAVVLQGPETPAEAVLLQRRGPLTVLVLRARDRLERFVFTTPGTLRADQRRQLTLWFDRHAARSQPQGWLPNV